MTLQVQQELPSEGPCFRPRFPGSARRDVGLSLSERRLSLRSARGKPAPANTDGSAVDIYLLKYLVGGY